MNIINRLKGKVVVSVQAMPSEPLYLEKCMVAMMKSVIKGGAGGLRVAGARDVKNAKHLFDVPIIGLTKPDIIPSNWQEIVYITPTLKEVIELVEAGADIIAFDGTMRERPNGAKLEELIKYVKLIIEFQWLIFQHWKKVLMLKIRGKYFVYNTFRVYSILSK